MDKKLIYNPYDFANPVSEAELLIGREKEMEEIKYYLDNAKNAPRPINIALLGQRASGKTSILNITEIEAKNRGFCTARINLDEDDAQYQAAFFFKLFDAIFAEACTQGAFNGIEGKTYATYLDIITTYIIPEDKIFCPFLFPIQYAKIMSTNNTNAQISDHIFQHDIKKIYKELKTPIILLFDEGNVLAQSRVLLQKLRNTFMNTPGFMLVMAGTPDLFPVMDEVFSPIIRQFKKITVGEFRNIDATRECIRKPLEKLGIKPSDIFDFQTLRDVSEIHNLSGGKPYEIQLICHMLFRRIEDKRAETMKLDFSVLEDVRKELEKIHDISTRPVLTKIRNLDRDQLRTLSFFCSFDRQLTLKQIWGLEYIFHGNSRWTEETLKKLLPLYTEEGILRNENGYITFVGDDFDKIYAKYFAREHDITFRFSKLPIENEWNENLYEFLVISVEDRLNFLFDIYRTISSIDDDSAKMIEYNIHTFSDIANEMSSPISNIDIFVERDRLAEDLYKRMVNTRDQKALTLFSVNPNLPWLNYSSSYLAVEPIDLVVKEEVNQRLLTLVDRIKDLEGNLTIERIEIPIISVEILKDKVSCTANKKAKHRLADYHRFLMLFAYWQERNYSLASFHANLSFEYDPNPNLQESNNLGYIFLSANDLHKAETLLKRAIHLSQFDPTKEDTVWPALPTYNLGIVRAQQGQIRNALADIQSCIIMLRNAQPNTLEIECLWVPIINNEELHFKEKKYVNLLKVADEAKFALETILTNKRVNSLYKEDNYNDQNF